MDSYNLVSLETLLSFGAHDLNKIEGDVIFKVADGNELFIPLGNKTQQRVNKGEQICADDKKVLCWIDIKQGDQTKITRGTKDVLIYVQGNKNVKIEYLDKAIEKVCKNVTEFCGGSVEKVKIKPKT